MSAVQILTALFSLSAGVGVFLIGCTMMSSNLESLGSGKIKALFAKASKSKLVGVGVGTVTTAVIQSSSATTVMVIGFVNAGIMTLTQAATVIFGANIGTTVTGQLVALGMFGDGSVSASLIFSSFAGAGAFVLAFAKKDAVRKTGGILAGFGMIFVGLSLMSGSMESVSESEAAKAFLAAIENPALLVLIGVALTAVLQSSSVMTSLTITMVFAGLINLNQGIYITMGANIGTCVTALLASVAAGRNAKRAALIHVIFNVGGAAVFLVTGIFLELGGINFGWLFEKMFPHAPQIQLAMFHTVFNFVTVILVLPLTGLLVKLVEKIMPEKRKPEKQEEIRLHFVDAHMLATPPIAVQQIKNEILNMAEIALKNFDIACRTVCTLDFSEIEIFRKNEEELNFLNKALFGFIVKLQRLKLSEKDGVYLSTAFRSVSDLERVGDYAENIVEYAENLKSSGGCFSSDAAAEIGGINTLIQNLYKNTVIAYRDLDGVALKEALEIEDKVDEITIQMAQNHIKRLSDGLCTPDVGAKYLSLASDSERVADHLINVAKTIKQF